MALPGARPSWKRVPPSLSPGLYLDNAATSWPKPEQVYCAVEHFMRWGGGTPARGRHPKSEEAGVLLDACRRRLTSLLGAGRGYHLTFTSGATESLNLALKGWLQPGDHVVLSDLEHNSVLRPLHALARDRGVTWTVVRSNLDGSLSPSDVRDAICRRTRLVVCSHASNVLGTRIDIEGIAETAHRRQVPVLVDAAQTVGVVPLKVSAWAIDMLAFTGHKSLLGPTGTGGLLFRKSLDIGPLKEGGTGTFSENPRQPQGFPERYESGSPNMYGIAGLLSAVGYLEKVGIPSIGRKKGELLSLLRDALSSMPEVSMYGSGRVSEQVGILGFNVKHQASDQTARQLWDRGRVMVRSGLHCAPLVHERRGTKKQGVVRVGIGYSTSRNDIEALVDCLRGILRG